MDWMRLSLHFVYEHCSLLQNHYLSYNPAQIPIKLKRYERFYRDFLNKVVK